MDGRYVKQISVLARAGSARVEKVAFPMRAISEAGIDGGALAVADAESYVSVPARFKLGIAELTTGSMFVPLLLSMLLHPAAYSCEMIGRVPQLKECGMLIANYSPAIN